jgi:hypothetical protein
MLKKDCCLFDACILSGPSVLMKQAAQRPHRAITVTAGNLPGWKMFWIAKGTSTNPYRQLLNRLEGGTGLIEAKR